MCMRNDQTSFSVIPTLHWHAFGTSSNRWRLPCLANTHARCDLKWYLHMFSNNCYNCWWLPRYTWTETQNNMTSLCELCTCVSRACAKGCHWFASTSNIPQNTYIYIYTRILPIEYCQGIRNDEFKTSNIATCLKGCCAKGCHWFT